MAYGMGDAPSKTDVSIYSLKTSKLKLLNTFEARQCNSIFWSPREEPLVMAGLKDMSDTLEFIDVDLKRSLVKSAHLMCREVLWDPTGRYVITAVTQPPGEENDFRSSMENGYKLWTMQGQEIAKSTFKTLYQVMWRPRPDLILSTEEVKKIEQNLKQYQGRFQREDDEIRLSLMSGAQKRLREWRIEWQKYREKKNAERKRLCLRSASNLAFSSPMTRWWRSTWWRRPYSAMPTSMSRSKDMCRVAAGSQLRVGRYCRNS